MLMALNRIQRVLRHLARTAIGARLCRLYLPRVPRGASDHRASKFFSLPGFALLNLVSVLANHRGLFGLAAGALLSGARARLHACGKRRRSWLRPRQAPCWPRPIGGRLIGRRISAERLAIAGAASIGAGLLLLGAWTEQTPTALRIAGLIVQGVGLGLFQLAYSDIVTAALPLRDRGVAGSLALLTRTLGTVGAASLVLMVFEILQTKHGFLEAFQQTFQLAALLAFVTAGLLALSSRKAGKPTSGA